jgi:hypothetical protein
MINAIPVARMSSEQDERFELRDCGAIGLQSGKRVSMDSIVARKYLGVSMGSV